ncbi:hypothetical protein LWI28_010642 [Acer negundo]|uniref:Copine C-terminal domain-containing protein n=1 Tax=Acer negundo TaxID=4023 RepID=A0AAD5J5B3_ACENE|nr:hypothetical protein LWI28_010642 [Acer negundo]
MLLVPLTSSSDLVVSTVSLHSNRVTEQNRTLTLNLHDKSRIGVSRNLGTLSVHAEETVSSKSAVEISFQCSRLANVDLFSKTVGIHELATLRTSLMDLWKIQKSIVDLQKLHLTKNKEVQILFYDMLIVIVLNSQLFVDKCVEKEQYAILDYISSGFELNFMAAVDFTVDFLIYQVEGVDGIMAAYASALHNAILAGPTLFGPVINMAAQIAGQPLSHDRSKYFVLLIITDGVLMDLQETKDALVRAFDLPLSILIVGVGGADFTQMEILDADNGLRLVSFTDRVATRDIVLLVPMREVHSGRISAVQALLEELPGQFLSYV